MSDLRQRLEDLSEKKRKLLNLKLQQFSQPGNSTFGAVNPEKQLVAYLTSQHQPPPAPDDLRNFLKQTLPDYMVPLTFTILDSLPKTPNGKIDRRALGTPPAASARSARDLVEPQDEWESELATIWQAMLQMTHISRHDNFFDLGGHSLLAIQLVAQIEDTFGKKLSLATLFQAPTIADLAAVLRDVETPATWSSLVPIQPNGSKPPLFIVHGGSGEVLFLHKLVKYFANQPLYGLQRRELSGQLSRQNSVEEMAAHYLEEVQMIQPEGPYFLSGFCIGGTIAFEMAQQLKAQGQQTELLALIGAGYPPGARRSHRHYLQRSAYHLQNGNFSFFGPYLQSARGKLSRKLRHRTRRSRPTVQPGNGTKWISDVMIKANYEPEVYPGILTLIETSGLTVRPWSKLSTEEIDSCIVGGSHVTMFEEPYLRVLAEKLRTGLERGTGANPPASETA